MLIVRGQREQGSGLLDRLLGHLVFLACALERRQLLVELLAGRRLGFHQVLDALVVLLRQHQLGVRRAERGGLGPQAGDPGPHLLLLPLDGPPRLLQRGHRGLDLVPSLIRARRGRSPATSPSGPRSTSPAASPTASGRPRSRTAGDRGGPGSPRARRSRRCGPAPARRRRRGGWRPSSHRRRRRRRRSRRARNSPGPTAPPSRPRARPPGRRRSPGRPIGPASAASRRRRISPDSRRCLPVRPIPRRMPRRGDRPRPRNRHALAARSDWLRHVRGLPPGGRSRAPARSRPPELTGQSFSELTGQSL